MLKTTIRAISFMKLGERGKFLVFLGLRALVTIFDLVAIFAFGYLATSIALFITSGSDSSRVIDLGGLLVPAVNAQTLPFWATSILVLFLLKAVASISLTRKLALFLALIEARAATVVVDRAYGEGLEAARSTSHEEIYFAVQIGSPAAFNAVLNSVGTLFAEGVLFVFVLISFFLVDPLAALGTVVYFGIIAAVIQFFIGHRMQKSSEAVKEGSISGSKAISDLGEVLREATVLGKKVDFHKKVFQARERAASSLADQLTLSGLPRYIVETALIIAVAIFVLAQASTGDLVQASGTLGIFLAGGLRLTASLLPLQNAFFSIKKSIPAADSALKFLANHAPQTQNPTGIKRRQETAPWPVEVKFNNVSFTYRDATTPAVTNLTLRVSAGQHVAIIGSSGSGKSTIADLMMGLLTPSDGAVSVGGQSPTEMIRLTPGRLSYVPQNPGMISGSVKDNITLGEVDSEVDSNRLEYAIHASHLGSVLEALPDGLSTNIGKRRDELSGGQLQRVGLARALYSNPGLLVMDEATSALDADSENEISKALEEMRGEVTVVLIAHRMNTVQKADVVYLIDQGQIVASGTFSELLRQNKQVQKIAKLMAIRSSDN